MKDKFIILLIFIALLSGFFWSHESFGHPPSTSGDEIKYHEAAVNLLENHGFSYQEKDIPCEPFYPLFLAGVYGIFGYNYDAVRVIQIILFALTVLIIYSLSKELFNKKIAVLSGLISALYYGLANPAGRLLRETLFMFLIMLLIYVLYRAYLKKGKKWFAFAGIILGLAALTNTAVQLLFFLIIINFLIIYKKKILTREIFLRCSVFLLFFLITLSPWLIRNYLQYSTISLAPLRGGEELISRVEMMNEVYHNYLGHFIGYSLGYYFAEKIDPQITSSQTRVFTPPQLEGSAQVEELLEQGYSPRETNQMLTRKALAENLAQPHKYLLMSFLAFIAFNNPIFPTPPTWGNSDIFMTFTQGQHPELPHWVKASIILAIRFVWLIFFVFIIYAIVKNIRNWPKFSWIFLIILYFNVIHSATHATPRYALPIYPLYIILFSLGLFIFINKHFMINKTNHV